MTRPALFIVPSAIIAMSGCQAELMVERPSINAPLSVNSDVAAQMAHQSQQDAQPIELGAGDGFGEVIHERYMQSLRRQAAR